MQTKSIFLQVTSQKFVFGTQA